MEQDEYYIMYTNENYHWWYKTLHNLVLKFVKKYSSSKKIELLDAGCGTGRMLELLKNENNITSYGIDFCENAVELCKKRELTNISVQDLNTVSLGNNKFDIIICNDVIYHKAIKNDVKIMYKFYNALKKNGILIMNSAAFNFLSSSHDFQTQAARRYNIPQLKNMLRQTGFTPLVLTYRLSFIFFPVLIFRTLINFLKKKNTKKSDLQTNISILNSIFYFVGIIENIIVFNNISLPFGTSVFLIARKFK